MRKYMLLMASISILLFGLCVNLTSCDKNEPKEEKKHNEPVFRGYGDGEIVISAFWPPGKGFATEEQYNLLVEGGIDLLEWGTDILYTDENTIKETLRLCNEKGIKITICDEDYKNILQINDDEIVELINRYKDNECVVGYYLKDEPTNANPYGRIARIIEKEIPGSISQVNMLPMGALSDPRGHAEDWINSVGEGKLRYLSFDQYPFGLPEGAVPEMFPNIDFVRKIGLKYNVDTALYIQSIGIENVYRRPTVSETRYHTSAALAYGYKNLKYFTWFTPPGRSENFTESIIALDGKTTDTFDGIAQINKDIKKVSKILGKLNAVEIYHNGRVDRETTMLEPGWYVESMTEQDFLVSLMIDRNDGTNYLMVVNKNYKEDATIPLKLSNIGSLTDVTSGTEKKVDIKSGTISCSIVAGGFSLFKLDQCVKLEKEYKDNSTTNLALDKPVYSTSSIGENGYYTYKAVDGLRTSSNSSKGWRYEGDGKDEVFYTVDLKRAVDLNRVDIYPAGSINTGSYGVLFPLKYSIHYSVNGKDYKKIDSYEYKSGNIPCHKFNTVNARYIKIVLDKVLNINDRFYAEICEIEVYNDTGNIPEYDIPTPKDDTLIPKYNVALNMKNKVSSSLEAAEWGWQRIFLNDGQIAYSNTHIGWTSMTKRNMDDSFAEEWAMIELDKTYSIDTVILYPRQNTGDFFPKSLDIEVSLDEENWSTVYSYKGSGIVSTEARIFKFDAVDAKYVRAVSKEMTKREGSLDGYVFQLAEFEVYRTGRESSNNQENTNKALGKLTFVSSSSEYLQWGWSQAYINDGIKEETNNNTGFTTKTGINKDDPNKPEWILFLLGQNTTISKVVLYPANNSKFFPSEFIVEVSDDGSTWRKVCEYKETTNVDTPRTVSFAKTQATFLKITTTKLRHVASGPDGYLFQIAEIEIY